MTTATIDARAVWSLHWNRIKGAARKAVSGRLSRSGIHARPADREDLQADAIGGAWERFQRWAQSGEAMASPDRAVIRCAVLGARQAVRDWCRARARNARAAGDCFTAPDTAPQGDTDRLVRVILRLPARLQPTALQLAQGRGKLDVESTGRNYGRDVRALRRDPACIDLLLAHVAETAAAGL